MQSRAAAAVLLLPAEAKGADNGVFSAVSMTLSRDVRTGRPPSLCPTAEKRDIVRLDGVPLQKAGHTAEHIDQFSDIAGPVVVQQYRFRCRVNLYFRESGVPGHAREQVFAMVMMSSRRSLSGGI